MSNKLPFETDKSRHFSLNFTSHYIYRLTRVCWSTYIERTEQIVPVLISDSILQQLKYMYFIPWLEHKCFKHLSLLTISIVLFNPINYHQCTVWHVFIDYILQILLAQRNKINKINRNEDRNNVIAITL